MRGWLLLAVLLVSGCASSQAATSAAVKVGKARPVSRAHARTAAASRPAPPRPAPPSYPRLLHTAPAGPIPFTPFVSWRGHYPLWVSRTPAGVALVSLNQRYLTLRLHSGTIDAGPTGWRWGPEVAPGERPLLLAAFNGGFKLDVGAGGFVLNGRVGAPLRRGLASIVTYTNGYSDIGSWGSEVPAPGLKVASVRQNLTLLIDHGQIASSVDCIPCWGATLGGVSAPARSALGITADGHLIWAGGMSLTPLALAQALRSAHVVRAIEMDINPEWVAFDLYKRPAGARSAGAAAAVTPVPIVPGQNGVPGQFLAPYSRDFYSVEAR